jgi:hypothetical protein
MISPDPVAGSPLPVSALADAIADALASAKDDATRSRLESLMRKSLLSAGGQERSSSIATSPGPRSSNAGCAIWQLLLVVVTDRNVWIPLPGAIPAPVKDTAIRSDPLRSMACGA